MRRPRPRSRALIATTVAAVATVALGAAALGYWQGAGAGASQTQLANVVAVTLSPGTPSDPLSPGDVGGVNVIVSNPNNIRAHVGSFVLAAASPAIAVDGAHGGCDTSALTFTTQTNGGAGWNVPPKSGAVAGVLTVELNGALSMSSTAADACQGARFTVAMDALP
ncbi:MAG: hypothetical protein ACR2KV_09160 [Solirubrobacteraceae bacterium]